MRTVLSFKRFLMAVSLSLITFGGAGTPAADSPKDSPAVDYAPVVKQLKAVVADELKRGIVSGVSIALVDDQQTVYAGGFGWADKGKHIPAQADTVYRAGSISKLFNALAVMQLVEQGQLDLDAPITKYLDDFQIVNPFPTGRNSEPVTLRLLMCHRSGLIREAPVGGYLDPSEPTIAETVASVAPCVMPLPPNHKAKYSNLGATVVGYAVQRTAGRPFETLAQQRLLKPLGMTRSAFRLNDALRAHLSNSYMRVGDEDGGYHEIESPRFALGTIPAGNLYTTAEDLARFCSFLCAEGATKSETEGRQLVRPHSLAEMFTPQKTKEPTGFGLGFMVGKFRDYKSVSHMGAVYGFTSSVCVIPELKLGVVVLANQDIAMGPVSRLNDEALGLLVDAKGGRPGQQAEPAAAPEDLNAFTGDYESQSYWAEVRQKDGRLSVIVSGQPMELTPAGGDKFLADGRYAYRAAFDFARNDRGRPVRFTALRQTFRRVSKTQVATIPEAWKAYLGSYGPEFIPLIVRQRHGHLYALTENMFEYRLRPVTGHVFAMPPGLYEDEYLVFMVGRDGTPHTAVLANMSLGRRGSHEPKAEQSK